MAVTRVARRYGVNRASSGFGFRRHQCCCSSAWACSVLSAPAPAPQSSCASGVGERNVRERPARRRRELQRLRRHDYAATVVDVQGRAGAGGNVSVTSYNVGVALPPSSSRVDLMAAGNLTIGGGGAQAQNGSVTYGGAIQGSITTPNGQVTRTAPPFDFAAEFTSLASQSLALAALPSNGCGQGGPSYAFDLTGSSATTNVFTLSATDLQKAQVIGSRCRSARQPS